MFRLGLLNSYPSIIITNKLRQATTHAIYTCDNKPIREGERERESEKKTMRSDHGYTI